MPIVHCPECRKPARVPDSERVMNVHCPQCRHVYQIPGSIADAEVVEDEPPVARQVPAPPAGSPFDFEGQQHRGEGPVVSSQAGRIHQLRAHSAGGWLLLAGILDGVPILAFAFYAALITIEPKATAKMAEVGAITAVVFCVVGLILVTPILVGARAMAGSWSYVMSIVGAIFAMVLGLLYGLFVFPAVLMLLAREVCLFVLPLGISFIGLISLFAGIRTLVALLSSSTRARFGRGSRDEEEEERRPARRRREEDEDERRPPRRRVADDDY